MEVHLPRRNRYSRSLTTALGCVAGVGVIVGGVKLLRHNGHRDAMAQATPGTPKIEGSVIAPATQPTPQKHEKSSPNDPAVSVVSKHGVLTHQAPTPAPKPPVWFDAPTTRPAMTIASKPAPTTPVDAVALFKSVDDKIGADQLVQARDELVAALDDKKFSDSEREAALSRLQKINDTVVFAPRKFVSDPHQTAYTVVAGDNFQKIANKYDVTIGFLQRINNISDPRKLRLGASLKIVPGPFHAIVNKTAFTLDLYQGKPGDPGAIFLKRLRVGLGENDSTPTGMWKIGTKLINPTYYNSRDTGPRVIAAGDPTNPLGERWLELVGISGQAVGKESYGIHGTIDPASIGKKMSLGCVRLLNEDVNLVYDMLIKEKSTVLVVE